MNPKSASFQKLQQKWYKKLEREGFEDIEESEDRLKQWGYRYHALGNDPIKLEAKEHYYRLAGQFLHSHQFINARQKTVWELHSEGMGTRSIVTTLKKKGVKIPRTIVCSIIRDLAKMMLETTDNG